MISAEEFEQQFAANSGLTVGQLRSRGRVVRRCKCDYEECQGWQSISMSMVKEMEQDWKDGLAPAPDWIDE